MAVPVPPIANAFCGASAMHCSNKTTKGEDLDFMKSTKHLFLTVLTLAAISAGAWAQTSDSTAPPPKKKHKAAQPAQVTAADVQELKDALAAQQEQIRQLREELHRKDQAVQQAQSAATDASGKADAAQAQAAQQQQAVTQAVTAVSEVKGEVADLKTTVNTGALALQETQKTIEETFQNPLSIHYKGISVSTTGFIAAEFVRRSRELGSDITTPFNSLTLPGASQSNLPEFFGTARQSRPTLFVTGRLKNVELSSYLSADFLSAGVTSPATQSNSYTFRLRQAWGQAKFDNGWKFLGGQMWSLVTENKAGIAPSDDAGKVNDARPATIDPQYQVGFSFARQYGLRLTKDFGQTVSVAFAIENAQGTLTTHENDGNYLLGEAGANNSYNTTANYTANPAPDLIAKIAFDPGFGHYEIFGLADRFTDRVFPCYQYTSPNCALSSTLTAPSVAGAYNTSKEGGGFGANARWTFADKHVVFGLHGFGGSGIGRYGAAQLSDLSINPDGTAHLIRNFQGVATLEWHGKKLDLYSYAGAEYAGRTYGFDPYLVVPTTTTTVTTAPGGVTTTTTYPIDPGYVGYGAPHFSNAGCYTETLPATGTPSGVTTSAGFDPGALGKCTSDTRAALEGTVGFWYRL